MKKAIVYILLSCFGPLINAQENEIEPSISEVKQARNVVYGNAEYYLFGGSVNLNYERFIYVASNSAFSLRGAYGRWSGGGITGGTSYGRLFKLTGNLLFSGGNNHVEFDLGVMGRMNDGKSGIQSVLPDVFLGYTYKKPDEGLVFKAGVGFLGFLSVGMGFAF